MAAVWAHYRWEEFTELAGEDQSAIVAAYRVSNQIEAVLATEAQRSAKKVK